MGSTIEQSALFEHTTTFPDVDARTRLARLVGLDEHKSKLTKLLGVLVNPQGVESWMQEHHPGTNNLLEAISRRSPLVVLAGDVGSGKTELAETIGDAVARQEKIDVTLYPLSLSTRGEGHVGEMTRLLSAAFEATTDAARKLVDPSGRARGAVILLVDEADALAQSREATQMHHEDRAGVNAFIRGVDRLSRGRFPAAVIMCTNRLGALDPAVRRRAAEVLVFSRPDATQREAALTTFFSGVLQAEEIAALVEVTGRQQDRPYGFTYSDIMQRVVPAIVLDAYPSRPVCGKRAVDVARSIAPTPPFKDLDHE